MKVSDYENFVAIVNNIFDLESKDYTLKVPIRRLVKKKKMTFAIYDKQKSEVVTIKLQKGYISKINWKSETKDVGFGKEEKKYIENVLKRSEKIYNRYTLFFLKKNMESLYSLMKKTNHEFCRKREYRKTIMANHDDMIITGFCDNDKNGCYIIFSLNMAMLYPVDFKVFFRMDDGDGLTVPDNEVASEIELGIRDAVGKFLGYTE